MTTPRARLLAILKEPDRCNPDSYLEPSDDIVARCADLNARHRLKRLCEEIAKVAREFPETPTGAYAGLMMTACRATSKDIAGEILALGEDNEHS